MMENKWLRYFKWGEVGPALLLLALVLGIISYTVYLYNQKESLDQQLSIAEKRLIDLRVNLASTTAEKETLRAQIEGERLKAIEADDRAKEIFTAVGVLRKLNETDKELLEKYSKVYFLNEHYVPSLLAVIDSKFIFEKGRVLQIHSNVAPFLADLITAARNEGIDISVLSSYRSYSTQGSLKNSYKVTYGAGTANKFSADQGYSEHQLGTAVDFTNTKVGGVLTGFDKTPTYQWLLGHAHQYGFILSYPANNKYYVFEPWHWRFVGVRLATFLHNQSQNFYDLDQRVIDQYLVNIFDR